MLFEEWQDWSGIENHVRSDSYRSILKIMALFSEQPEIKFCSVSNTKGQEVTEG
jgi:quinol monooxygenase YgiN